MSSLSAAPAHAMRAGESSDILKAQLIQELYATMSREAIATMAAANVSRARTEVAGALRVISSRFGRTQRHSANWDRVIEEIVADLLGLGPIDGLVADQSVTEIMVNGTSSLFYERAGQLFEHPTRFQSESQLRTTIDRIIAPLGRRLDEQNPLVSGRLPQGHRVHAAIPPIALDGSVLTVRKFRERSYTLDELVNEGSISEPVATLLRWAVQSRRNIAVSGGTGTGKTTLLNALAACVSPRERIITIEDSAELRFDVHPHVVRLEARPANQEGNGSVSIRDLVVNALRMRPDRIVVGEVRGEEALEMLQAMNTGHDGSLTTLHANSAAEVPRRLLTMVGYSGIELPSVQVEAQIASAIDVIVHLSRGRDGVRRISEIAEVGLDERGSCRLHRLVGLDEPILRVGEAIEGPRWRVLSGGALVKAASEQGVATSEEVARWMHLIGCSRPR